MSEFLSRFKVKVFADGADRAAIAKLLELPYIQGFTTNPTLMRKAGVTDYEPFCRDLLHLLTDRPISFEVFSDEFDEMERQARRIATWGANVNVKIPITNTRREGSYEVVRRLASDGIAVNVTALFTLDQVDRCLEVMQGCAPSYLSIFAGRVADAGVDPLPLMREAVHRMQANPKLELIWASPREVLNIVHADQVGCHVITVTHDLLKKIPLLGKNLEDYSLETVQMFHDDARAAGYTL